MTANPEDYGDSKPSDLDDVPPQNRGGLLEEHAYRINKRIESKLVKPRQPALVNPDLQQQVEKLDVRTSFMAVILSRTRKGEYVVLRQDGKRGTAFTRGDDAIYDALSPGEYVSLENGTIPDTYYITGDARHLELDTLVLYNTEIIGPTNTSKKITVDAVELETGGTLEAFNGGFRVLQDTFALYEISYSFSVEQTDNYEADGLASITIGNDCGSDSVYLEAPRPFTGFRADQNSGLKVRHSVDDRCNAYLAIDVQKDNYVPTTTLLGDTVWSDVGHIGNSLKVGMDVPRGWLHIGRAFSKVSLAAGNKELKVIFPNNSPVNGSHLFAEGIGTHPFGECVQLRWTKAGGNGVIQAYNCYSQCVQWVVENGLIISGPGITSPSGSGVYVDCTETPESIYDCET